MVQPCEPRELVAMVRAGDIAALDRITRCHGQRLLAVGRRYCRNEQEALDAVQDALLAAGTHLGSFRGEGSVEGWVVRMVANACHRMRRGRKNDPALHVAHQDLPGGEPSSRSEDPEVLAGRAMIARALGEALIALKPRDRAILLLAEAEDWTGPEIGRELGMTAGAVRTRLARARSRVRRELEGLAPDP